MVAVNPLRQEVALGMHKFSLKGWCELGYAQTPKRGNICIPWGCTQHPLKRGCIKPC